MGDMTAYLAGVLPRGGAPSLPQATGWSGDIVLTYDRYVQPGLQILAVLIAAVLLRWLLLRVISRLVTTAADRHSRTPRLLPGRAGAVLADASGLAHERYLQRTQTIGSLLRSTVTFVVASIAILTFMAILAIPLAPVLTSAGVGGVALGIGAQSLVKDFLSGIFMIVEDQYGVGDWVDVGEVLGVVEEVSLRVTRIRDRAGVVWYVRNGEIIRVGNTSQGWSTATVDVPLALDTDIARATHVIREGLAGMAADPALADIVLDDALVEGVESMSQGVVVVRVSARCAAMQDGAVRRLLRERVKAAFDAAGLQLGTAPTPQGAGPAGGRQ
jgi:small conductance mechanosensitive channel